MSTIIMVPKPPVDIEWYDDGLTIKEQNQLRKKYKPSIKIKVTEQYHKSSQEKIISDLRAKLAADEEYIQELEEDFQTLSQSGEDYYYRNKYEKTKAAKKLLEQKLQAIQQDPETEIGKAHLLIKALQKQISKDAKEARAPYDEQLKAQSKEIKELRSLRDTLLGKLYSHGFTV